MTVAARRRLTLAKLGEVARKLEEVLAGQDLTLADIDLPQEAEPGETPVERLRRFKDLLQATLDGLRAGTIRTCARCGRPLSEAALDAMPWATTCGAC